jgi:hypothetical protein
LLVFIECVINLHMKPKTVVITLLVPFVAVALLGIFNAMMGKKVEPEVVPIAAGNDSPAVPNTNRPSDTPKTEPLPAGTNSLLATTRQEDLLAQREKELDAISQALIEGSDDPQSMITIASRLDYPDAEVRAAAREAAKHLGDTNMIPRLSALIQEIQDPREKVALMDIVAFLEAPIMLADPVPASLGPIPTNSLPPLRTTKKGVSRPRAQSQPQANVITQ